MEKFRLSKGKYKCIFCNILIIEAKNLNKHLSSKTHLSNEQNVFYCKTCKYVTKHKITYDKHINTQKHILNKPLETINSQNLVSIMKDMKKDIIKNVKKGVINDFKKDVINDFKKDIIDEMNKNKISRQDVKEIVKEGIDESKFAKTTSAILKKLQNNHSNNPPLLCLDPNSSQILLTKKFNNKLSEDMHVVEKTIIIYYKNKKLVTDLVNLLLSQIKTKDINKQAVFVSDISRLSYLVKITVKDWSNDKKGIKFSEKVIEPLLDTIKSRIKYFHNTFIDEEEDNDYNEDNVDFIFYRENYEHVSSLIKNINNGTLCQEILSKISPHLQYRDNIILELENE